MPCLSPQTLTHEEMHALLAASRGHARDHLIFSLALGTGLRLAELVGLDVADVFFPTGEPRVRVRIRREIAKRGRAGDVFLPGTSLPMLRASWTFELRRGECGGPAAPLLCAKSLRRISPHRVQVLSRTWQVHAGFHRLYPFHAIRQTAVGNVHCTPCDFLLAQRFARRASLLRPLSEPAPLATLSRIREPPMSSCVPVSQRHPPFVS